MENLVSLCFSLIPSSIFFISSQLMNKKSSFRIPVAESQKGESGVDSQCICQPPYSFPLVPEEVAFEVQRGESGIVAGEPADSLVQLGV